MQVAASSSPASRNDATGLLFVDLKSHIFIWPLMLPVITWKIFGVYKLLLFVIYIPALPAKRIIDALKRDNCSSVQKDIWSYMT